MIISLNSIYLFKKDVFIMELVQSVSQSVCCQWFEWILVELVTLESCLFQTPRTYNAANFEDLSEVVRHVKSLNPGVPLAAAGVSLGGYVLMCL